MSLELLELGAAALGPLLEEVVFVGGASVVLWITDPAAPPPRPTNDVDVIVEVVGRWGYEQFSKRLRAEGSLINGRDALVEEVRVASGELRTYLAQQIVRRSRAGRRSSSRSGSPRSMSGDLPDASR